MYQLGYISATKPLSLAGYKEDSGHHTAQLPITLDIMKVSRAWYPGNLTVHIMIWAAYCLSFFGFLGE